MVEAQKAEQKTKKTFVYSNPTFKKVLKINSSQAQQIINRKFERVKVSLFNIDVILPIITTQEKIDEVENFLREEMKKVAQDIDESEAKFKKLIEDYGIEDAPIYTSPLECEIEITSPQVAQFVGLVKKLDSLIEQMDTLWFQGLLTNKQRKDGTYQWQQRLLKLADRITGIAKRARAAAYAQGKPIETLEAIDAIEGEASLDNNEEDGCLEDMDEVLLQEEVKEEAGQ